MDMLITVIKPSFEIWTPLDSGHLKLIERAGRICYKSEDKITDDSADQFVRMLIRNGHESVLEHVSATVKLICSRSCSHQLVRHRLNSFSQESMRFCNYGKLGFKVICPTSIGVPAGLYYIDVNKWCDDFRQIYSDEDYTTVAHLKGIQYDWLDNRIQNYLEYLMYLDFGIRPEDARDCLPNATATELVMTCNLRQWRHIFKERALNSHAQKQIRDLMLGILQEFKQQLPPVFEDLV